MVILRLLRVGRAVRRLVVERSTLYILHRLFRGRRLLSGVLHNLTGVSGQMIQSPHLGTVTLNHAQC